MVGTHALDRWFPEPLAAKVPEIALLFWVVKLLTTAAGEASSDYFATHSKAIGAAVEIIVVLVGVLWQFKTRRYVAPAYWFLALAIATTGTGVSDTMHLVFGIPYGGTTFIWIITLSGVFFLWSRTEHTLSIHSIVTRQRELFYWATIFATFALGTALGDFTAFSLNLGYLTSILLFGSLLFIPLIGWRYLRMNSVLAFWLAYILTRPLGASFADYFCKPKNVGGIGVGTVITSLVLLGLVAGLVAYLTVTRNDIQPESVGR